MTTEEIKAAYPDCWEAVRIWEDVSWDKARATHADPAELTDLLARRMLDLAEAGFLDGTATQRAVACVRSAVAQMGTAGFRRFVAAKLGMM